MTLRSTSSGFTFIELIVALAILSILAAFAFSGFKQIFDNQTDKILQSQLLEAIQFAQQEAHIQKKSIGLCKSNNSYRCSGEWRDGFVVFIDESEDGDITDKSQILSAFQAIYQQGKVYARSYPAYRDYFQFSADLLANDNGTLWYCEQNHKNPKWSITISKSGQTQVTYANRQGFIHDSSGKLLTCE